MRYAIGRIGEPVRMYIDAPTIEDVEMQFWEGEVALEVDNAAMPGAVIGEDGLYYPEATLADRKAEKRAAVEQYRDYRVNLGCLTSVGMVATDLESRVNLSASVTMANMNPAFSIDWRLMDNSMVTLDSDQMRGVGVQVAQFVALRYAASFTIKDTIDAAASFDDLDAIDVTAGYPA